MSSLYTRSKEYTRSRKAQSDSPPSSPSPIAKTLRVSSFFLSVLPCSAHALSRARWWRFVVLPLETCGCGFLWKEDGLNETWDGASAATGFKQAARVPAQELAVSGVGNCRDGSFLLSWNMALPWLLLDENIPGKNEAEPDQLVKLHFFQNTLMVK